MSRCSNRQQLVRRVACSGAAAAAGSGCVGVLLCGAGCAPDDGLCLCVPLQAYLSQAAAADLSLPRNISITVVAAAAATIAV
jgi:hypothetical protein